MTLQDSDKMIEFLVSDLGEMRIVLRPELPFKAEGYRIIDDERLEIFGEDRRISFPIDGDNLLDVINEDIEQALLVEFGRDDVDPIRERDILRMDEYRDIP